MATTFEQEDYYSVDNIEERLSEALGTDEWENIKQTDLGQALLRWGANVIHQDAMAFFTGLDQFFKSTVTLSGYLEEIAKSKNVIPKTYTSATVTVVLYSNGSAKTYGPMEFSMVFGSSTFYNIEDVTIGTVTDPTTVVLYEGTVVRKASTVGTPTGSLWSYSQLSSPIAVKLGDKVIRRYLLLPKTTLVDSIMVESSSSLLIPFVRWSQVSTWYNVSQTSRSWKLGKDFLGRYQVEFGDGVYGRVYPTTEITGLRYLLSSGTDVEVDDLSSYKMYYQDSSSVDSLFTILSVSSLVDGSDEIDQSDLHLEIENAETTRDALIKEADYTNYLESRSDVKSAVVIAERHSDPPNIEYFNRITYTIKPNVEGGSFNDAEIQAYLSRYGLDTVEFYNADFNYKKFNITVQFGILDGYTESGVTSLIESTVTDEFSWDNLGFEEKIIVSRVYDLVKDLEGLDTSELTITVESVVTATDTGSVVHDVSTSEVFDLSFYPKRFKIYATASEAISGTTGRDNGDTYLVLDMTDYEQFEYDGLDIARNTLLIDNMLLFGDGSGTRYMAVQLQQDEGGVNQVWFDESLDATTDILASAYVDRYEEIVNITYDSADYKLVAYSLPSQFFDSDEFDYIQRDTEFDTVDLLSKSITVTTPTNAVGVYGMLYYNSYIYVLWQLSTGNHRLYRYRINQTTLYDYDTLYNSTGFLELGTKAYRNMVLTEDIFSSESVIWIASDDGIDAVRSFDDQDGCYYESDFFETLFPEPTYTLPIDWRGLATDGSNLYGIRVDNASQHVITRIYSITDEGSGQITHVSDDSLDTIRNIVYDNFESRLRVYFYDSTNYKVYYIDYNTTEDAPTARAGTTSGTTSSLQRVATINHGLRTITFTEDLTDVTLWYESEEEIAYTGSEMAVLNELTVEYVE